MKTVQITISRISNGFVTTGTDCGFADDYGQPAETPTIFHPDVDSLCDALPSIFKDTLTLDQPKGAQGTLAFIKDMN